MTTSPKPSNNVPTETPSDGVRLASLRRDWQFAADSRSGHGAFPAPATREHQLRYTEACVAGDHPAKTIEQPSDDRVVRRDGGDKAVETTLLRRIEQRGDERGADSLPLPVVLNNDGHLRRRLVDRAETRKGHHPGATGGLIFSDDRETSAIVHARETAHERIGQRRDRRQEPQV